MELIDNDPGYVTIRDRRFKILQEKFVRNEKEKFNWHHYRLAVPNTHHFYIATRKEFDNGEKDQYIIC